MIKNKATLLQQIQDNFPDNTSRLITEEIMRNESSDWVNSLANLIDDKPKFNLRDFTDREYDEGEFCFYDDGTSQGIYRANQIVSGSPFNPSEWDLQAALGVVSFNGRNGSVMPQLGDYGSNIINNDSSVSGSTVSDALDYLESQLSVSAINQFYVNSNNINPGTGTIDDPYQTEEIAKSTIIGTGTSLDPELVPIGQSAAIIVQSGSYTCSSNLLINRCNWVYELGAESDYTGTDARYVLDSNVFNPAEYTESYILGAGKFTTSTGSIFRNDLGDSSNGAKLTIEYLRIDSNVIDANPEAHPVFNIDKVSTNIAFNSCLELIGINKSIIFSGTQTIIKSGDKTNNRGRVPFSCFDCFFIIGSVSTQATMSANARIADVFRPQLTTFKNCWFSSTKSDYIITVDGPTRLVQFDNCRFLTSGSSSAIKSLGILEVGDEFLLSSDGGGSSAVLSLQIINSLSDDKNFTNPNDLIVFNGAGNLTQLYLNNNNFQGKPSSNINIAESISFEGDGVNPKPFTVLNYFDGSMRIDNIPDSSGSLFVLTQDPDGNLEKLDISSFPSSASNGIEINSGDVKLGTNPLIQPTSIPGGGQSFSLGEVSNRLGYTELNTSGGVFFSNVSNGSATGFMDISCTTDSDGFAYGVFQLLPSAVGDVCTYSFASGSNTTGGDYFGIPYENGYGEFEFISYSGDTVSNTATVLRTHGNDSFYGNFGTFGIMSDVFGTRTMLQGFTITPTNSFEFTDTKSGKGLSFNNWTVDQANVNTTTDKSAILSIGLGETIFGDVKGPTSTDDLNLAAFDGTTGKLLRDITGVKLLSDGSIISPQGHFIQSTNKGMGTDLSDMLFFKQSGINFITKAAGVSGDLVIGGAFRTSINGGSGAEIIVEDAGPVGIGVVPLQDFHVNKTTRFDVVANDNTATQILARDSNNDLVYVDKSSIVGISKYTETINTSDWVAGGTSGYYFDIVHPLVTEEIIVSVRDLSTKARKSPNEEIVIDSTTLRIESVNNTDEYTVTIIG